jgi:DNA-directed RNA polymerase subunit beta
LISSAVRSTGWSTPRRAGLRETIDDVSPIEDYTGNLAVVFEEINFDDPVAPISECREKDLTYARPLTVKVAFQNRETGEIREQSVFMGDFPWMTDWGTFIINGTERVVVTQLVRSPGAYVMEPKDRDKQVFIANLMPARGSWLELEIDKKGRVYVRIDRKRKLPVTVLLRAMGDTLREGKYVPEGWTGSDEEILGLFDNSLYMRLTLEADTEVTKSEDGALIELFKKQRPGRAAVDRRREEPAQAALLRPQALRPHAGRPLQAEQPPAPGRVARHPGAHAARHHRADQGAHLAPARARHPRVGHVRGRARRRGADQGLRARGHLDAA